MKISDSTLKLLEECRERSKYTQSSVQDILLAELCTRCQKVSDAIGWGSFWLFIGLIILSLIFLAIVRK